MRRGHFAYFAYLAIWLFDYFAYFAYYIYMFHSFHIVPLLRESAVLVGSFSCWCSSIGRAGNDEGSSPSTSFNIYCREDKWLSRKVHALRGVGSIPTSATKKN